MTDEQWEALEERSRNVFFTASLLIDGYEVTIQKGSLDKNAMRFGLAVFIGGQFKGEWILNDCEERRRFYHCKKRYAHSLKSRNAFKNTSIKLRKELGINTEEKFESYSSIWTNFKSMRRHFEKNNKDIQLIKEGSA